MIKLEEKEYELGKFFQFDPLLKYLDALNQSHNDLKDLVSKLQLQLDTKDRKISELEGKIQQNASSTDKRCKGIEITINNISKSITGLKGNNFKTKDEGKEQSKETIQSKDCVEQEDSYRSEKKNEEIKEVKQEETKPIEKEDIDYNKESLDKIEENENNEYKDENNNNEEQEKKENNEKEIDSQKKDSSEPQINYPEEKEQKVKEEKKENKKDDESINEPSNEQIVKSNISPEMLSILFKKVKDHQSRIEDLEKVSDTVLSTNKNLKHFEKNINNRVSILEQNTNKKIEDCKNIILINYSISEVTRT